MIVRPERGERSPSIGRGDVVYDTTNKWPLYFNLTGEDVACPHAGIVLSAVDHYDGRASLKVLGLPAKPEGGAALGTADWPDCGWQVDVVAQMLNVPEEALAQIPLLWSDIKKEVSKLPGEWYSRQVRWDAGGPPYSFDHGPPYKRFASGGHGSLSKLSGTCVGFVEYCYEQVGLDLVADDNLQLTTLPTTIQMHAFYSGVYPLSIAEPVDDNLLSYPECIECGTPDPRGSAKTYPIQVRP